MAGTTIEGPFPTAYERFPRIRQSTLSTYDNCALSAKFDIELRSDWTTHRAALGTICHRVFAKCLEDMVLAGERRVPKDVALAVLDEVYRQHDVPMIAANMGDEVVNLPLRLLAEARIIVRTWAQHSVWDIDKIASVERRLSTTLTYPDPDGVAVEREFTGKLDVLLVDGVTATVVDFKTSWGIPSEGTGRGGGRADGESEAMASSGDNISEEGYFQMRAYALLVFRTYPRIQRVVMREVYPRYLSGKVADRRGRPINPVRQATIDRYVLPEIEAEMSALVERFDRSVESDVWRPAPGSHCSYCPRPEACTIFPTARAEGRISSQEEAERYAGRLNVLDALKSQTTKALRAWSNVHGDVPVRDAKRPRVYGPVVRTRTKRPDADVLAAHLARGGRAEDLYVTEQYVEFCVHTPEEVHPNVAEVRREEEALLAMERAAAERKAAKEPPLPVGHGDPAEHEGPDR